MCVFGISSRTANFLFCPYFYEIRTSPAAVGHLRGVEREGHRHLTGIDPALELGEPAAAADEVDAFVGARVGDAEKRLDDVPGEQRDRQLPDRIVLRDQIGPERKAVPSAGEIHAELGQSCGADGPIGTPDREALAQFGKEFFRVASVQIPDHAVVVQDGHLVMRKNHRQEIAVRTRANSASPVSAATRPSRSSATRSIDNSLGGILLHW